MYIKSTTVYVPSSELNWDSPTPLPQASVPPPHTPKPGVGPHSPAVRGWGRPNSDDWTKSFLVKWGKTAGVILLYITGEWGDKRLRNNSGIPLSSGPPFHNVSCVHFLSPPSHVARKVNLFLTFIHSLFSQAASLF
jgi:hypothetical protein